MNATVEICVTSIESALAAQAGGADRVELCENLAVGGVTPSAGLIATVCRKLGIPVHVLIRPRGGDFCVSALEFEVMTRDVETAKSLGATGIVVGILDPEGHIDWSRTEQILDRARPMSITFHKAFDQALGATESLETLATIGIDRILTSGGSGFALAGIENLARLVGISQGRVAIMAGGGIDRTNVRAIVERGGVREIHAGSSVLGTRATLMRAVDMNSPAAQGLGALDAIVTTDAERVRELVAAVRASNCSERSQ